MAWSVQGRGLVVTVVLLLTSGSVTQVLAFLTAILKLVAAILSLTASIVALLAGVIALRKGGK
jgi:hypothetical protein